MNQEKMIKNLAIWGGPIGWAACGLYYAGKLVQDQCALRKEERRKKVLMGTIHITDGDIDYSLQVPKYKISKYHAVTHHLEYRLAHYRKAYNKRKPDETILRMLAIDIAVFSHPIDFCEDRVHKQINICGEIIDLSIKSSQVWLYEKVAKRLLDRYTAIQAQYGDSINDKEAMWLLLLETDSRNFIGL